MQQIRLETNLTNLLMTELARTAKSAPQAPESDGYLVIEVLRDAAFGPDDFAKTAKFQRVTKRGIGVVDVDSTVPYPVHSAIYEKIDVVASELGAPRTRKRHETTRALIVRPMPEHSAAYERIEIAPIARPSITAMTSGTFEAGWFVAPDDMAAEAEHAEPRDYRWVMIAAAAVALALVAVVALY
jgi:hypothetical protein